MEVSFVSIVHQELGAVRDHLITMVEPLTQEELWWVPPRSDGTTISYHMGHIGLVEDTRVSQSRKERLGPEAYSKLFGVANNSNSRVLFPGREEIFAYLAQARTRTLALLDTLQLNTPPSVKCLAAADLFRRIINHEYSHTKYIRRLLGEQGKNIDFPPPSARVEVKPQAVAAPQYFIPNWSREELSSP